MCGESPNSAAHTLEAMSLGETITSRSNARVKRLRAAFSGGASQPGEMLGIEGEHLMAEAIRSGLGFETVFVREGSEDALRRPSLAGMKAAEVVVLSADVFTSAVDTRSPQGIAALLPVPELAMADLSRAAGPVLVLEGLQDPGNLGTILRSAEAFGVQQIFVTPETVSQWNPKVVRASAGSVFRVPVERAPLAAFAVLLSAAGYRIFGAVAQAEGAVAAGEAEMFWPSALMVGNEGAGLSAAALELCAQRVHIPCRVESLNVAAAVSVLLYVATQRGKPQVPGRGYGRGPLG
jgi:TrmH family RNA methyltransferase